MRRSRLIPLSARLGACVAIAGVVHLLSGTPVTTGRPRIESLEEAILDAARHKPEDASLDLLFDQLNARHFGGRLPNVKVMWEPDLDRLDVGDYRLNGMTNGSVILLKAALKDDADSVRRTLCHEMVHVRFIAAGNGSTTHDPSFQSELRRIFHDGCFHAIWASAEEQASLKVWIDAERTRLDAGRLQVSAQSAAIKLAADEVERTFIELNERIRMANSAGSGWPHRNEVERAERQRADANNGILAYNAAAGAIESDQAHFNEVVHRYNLMLVYPDGLAEDRAKGLIR